MTKACSKVLVAGVAPSLGLVLSKVQLWLAAASIFELLFEPQEKVEGQGDNTSREALQGALCFLQA